MKTIGTHNVLVYRNNDSWRALESELMDRATGYYEGDSRKWVAVDSVTTKIFPEGIPESEIEQWVRSETALLQSAERVYCDGTSRRIMENLEARKKYSYDELEQFLRDAAREVFGIASPKASPAEVYRKIFALLATTAGVQRVQIVLENLADYNPLMIEGFEKGGWYPKDKLVQYAEEFRKLIPSSVIVEFITIADLVTPGEHTVAIAHHHILCASENRSGLHSRSPRVLMPYPEGFISQASSICDIGSAVQGNILDVARRYIKPRK